MKQEIGLCERVMGREKSLRVVLGTIPAMSRAVVSHEKKDSLKRTRKCGEPRMSRELLRFCSVRLWDDVESRKDSLCRLERRVRHGLHLREGKEKQGVCVCMQARILCAFAREERDQIPNVFASRLTSRAPAEETQSWA